MVLRRDPGFHRSPERTGAQEWPEPLMDPARQCEGAGSVSRPSRLAAPPCREAFPTLRSPVRLLQSGFFEAQQPLPGPRAGLRSVSRTKSIRRPKGQGCRKSLSDLRQFSAFPGTVN